MSVPWSYDVRKTGILKIHNLAGAWLADVEKAVSKFKSLGFPVELKSEQNDKDANVVIKLSSGADSHPFNSKYYEGVTVKTGSDFRADAPHGSTVAVFAAEHDEILFAVIFLPGLLANPSAGMKEVVITHEFIHACGMVSKEKDKQKNKKLTHDHEGIMYDIMITSGGGLIEGNKPKGKKAMPPIRVGGKTRNEIKSAWSKD